MTSNKVPTSVKTINRKAPKRFAISELAESQRRVGIEPRDRLEWAIRFAQSDDPTTTGDWLNLRMELFSYAVSLVWWEKIPRTVREPLKDMYRRPTAPEFMSEKSLPDELAVKRARQALRGILDELLKTGHFIEKVERAIYLPTPLRRADVEWQPKDELERWVELRLSEFEAFWKYPPHEFSRERDLVSQARGHFLDLLDGLGEYLRICPGTHPAPLVFAANRLNQEYCDTPCQNRSAVNRSRARKDEKQ
jgi:hypothetical protein